MNKNITSILITFMDICTELKYIEDEVVMQDFLKVLKQMTECEEISQEWKENKLISSRLFSPLNKLTLLNLETPVINTNLIYSSAPLITL